MTTATLADNSCAVSELFCWRVQEEGSLERTAKESATACSHIGLEIELQALEARLEQRGLTPSRGRVGVRGSGGYNVAARQREARQGSLRRLRAALFEGDEDEHREIWDYVRRALDEDRFSDRKLFP